MGSVDSGSSDVAESTLGSGLVIDIDHRSARAVLFDMVERHGRFVAAASTESTLSPPIDDPSVAIHQLLHGISEQVGKPVLGDEAAEAASGGGQFPDFVVVTGQPVSPNRLAILPAGDHPLVASLVAVSRATTTVVSVLGDQVRNEDGGLVGTRLEAELRAFQPDTVLLLAGDKTQLEWTTAVGTLKDLLAENVLNQIIVLASEQLQQQVAQMMGEDANLTGLDPGQFTVDEVASAIELELHGIYDSRVADEAAGLIPGDPVFVNRGRAADLVARFTARRREQSVVAATIDDGTLITWANPTASQIVNRLDFDVNAHAIAVMGMDTRRVTQLLPFSISLEDMYHWLLNRSLRPAVVAETRRDQLIESAVASEVLRTAWSEGEGVADTDIGLVIGGPLFARWYSPTLGVLSLLNAFQPTPSGGLVEVVLDAEGLFLAAGAVGERSPALAADAVEYDLLTPAASVIVVEGSGTEGDLAIRGEMAYEDGETVSFTVPFGSLHVVPLGDGEPATLTLTCETGFSVGGVSSGESIEFGNTRPLRGGPVGVIIDARGRPLEATGDPALGTTRVASWFADLGISHATA